MKNMKKDVGKISCGQSMLKLTRDLEILCQKQKIR